MRRSDTSSDLGEPDTGVIDRVHTDSAHHPAGVSAGQSNMVAIRASFAQLAEG